MIEQALDTLLTVFFLLSGFVLAGLLVLVLGALAFLISASVTRFEAYKRRRQGRMPDGIGRFPYA